MLPTVDRSDNGMILRELRIHLARVCTYIGIDPNDTAIGLSQDFISGYNIQNES